MARELRRRTRTPDLVIAGGCGFNCVANGRILHEGTFDRIYVPPVPHDAGGALGAAMGLYVASTGRRPDLLDHAQLGPSYGNGQIQSALKGCADVQAEELDEGALVGRAADWLASGRVVGWIQGRMEYGPRALGNRSFLADPRSNSIRDVIESEDQEAGALQAFCAVREGGEGFRLLRAPPALALHDDRCAGKTTGAQPDPGSRAPLTARHVRRPSIGR